MSVFLGMDVSLFHTFTLWSSRLLSSSSSSYRSGRGRHRRLCRCRRWSSLFIVIVVVVVVYSSSSLLPSLSLSSSSLYRVPVELTTAFPCLAFRCPANASLFVCVLHDANQGSTDANPFDQGALAASECLPWARGSTIHPEGDQCKPCFNVWTMGGCPYQSSSPP